MDDAFERERERQLHRAHLAESRRRAALKAAHEKRRGTRLRSLAPIALGAVLLGSLALFAGGLEGIAQEGEPRPTSNDPTFFPNLVAGSATIDQLRVRGSVRVVDEAGRELAVIGRESGNSGERGPVVFGLYTQSPRGPQQTLRLAASDSGAALSVRTPDGQSAVTLLAGGRGPEIELLDGQTKRVLSEEAPPTAGAGPTTVVQRVEAARLPAVGAAMSPAAKAYDVDLNVEAIQPVGHGFMIVGLDAADRGGKLRVVGRIINTSSVVHSGVDFRIGFAGQTASFSIPKISPGNSTGFLVDVPGLTRADIESARLEYLGSTIQYHTHSTRGELGRVTLR